MTDNTFFGYGVFSRFTLDDAPDAEETLYHTRDTKKDALIALGKMIVFRAFGQMSFENFAKVAEGLDKIVESEDITKCLNVRGITYYVREMTFVEAESINCISVEKDGPIQLPKDRATIQAT